MCKQKEKNKKLYLNLNQPFFFFAYFFFFKNIIYKNMNELEQLKKQLKKVSKKPIMKTYISKVDKKKKRIIINNPKEFSEKYLYN